MNFVAAQRRTIVLTGAFLLLFCGVGLVVDAMLVGAPLPLATLAAFVVATIVSLLGWRRGAPTGC